MSAVQRTFRNNDAEPATRFRGDESVYASIRLAINEIVQVTSLSLMPPLVHNSAPLEVVGQEILHFTGCGLPEFPLFYVRAYNDIRAQAIGITPLHIVHEMVCRFQRGFVKEIVVITESRRAHRKDPDEKQ